MRRQSRLYTRRCKVPVSMLASSKSQALSTAHCSQRPLCVLYQGARHRVVVTKAMFDYPLCFFSWFLKLILTWGVVLTCLLEVYCAAQSDSSSVHLCRWHWQGWMKHGFYCYSVGQFPATFAEARQICEENKGYLATVTDRYGNIILVLLYVQPGWKGQTEISSYFAVFHSVSCDTTPLLENLWRNWRSITKYIRGLYDINTNI